MCECEETKEVIKTMQENMCYLDEQVQSNREDIEHLKTLLKSTREKLWLVDSYVNKPEEELRL